MRNTSADEQYSGVSRRRALKRIGGAFETLSLAGAVVDSGRSCRRRRRCTDERRYYLTQV
ncbi:hypothetical protein [Haloferax mucosum]|uniref:hypothetical protein n=1 Tax=Haloferax mucosum TaxID=403181 RepID=UPI0003256D88|nr:hypothetical protein [Haloferax mucosum]